MTAVVTGDDADEGTAPTDATKLRWTDKPILVYVCDDVASCSDSEKFETIVLADEKVALGVRAFRCVRMTPSQVEADKLLADNGKGTPRVLIVNPDKPEKIKVLEADDLKASKLFKEMKSVSNKFWKEKLDKIVKEHMGLLTDQDQLANAEKTLADQITRAADDEKKREEREEERKELQAQLKEIVTKQVEIWKLTRKA